MTFLEHLDELRTRLIFSIGFLVAGCLLGTLVAKPLLGFLFRPFDSIKIERREPSLRFRVGPDGRTLSAIDPIDRETLAKASPYRVEIYLPDTPETETADFVLGNALRRPVFTSLTDPMMLFFQAAIAAGLIFALPFVLHQLWLFVAPGLKPNEKKTVIPLLSLGFVLFPLGAAFAYFSLRMVMNFLVNFQAANIEPLLEVYKFVKFELALMIAFGAVFEMPLVAMLLTFLGVLKPSLLRQYRPHAVVVLAFAAGAVTPGSDPFSMLIALALLVILYEVSIWLSIPLAARRERAESTDVRIETPADSR